LRCLTGDRWQTGFFSSDREMDLRTVQTLIPDFSRKQGIVPFWQDGMSEEV
jgi:hypothetical protein